METSLKKRVNAVSGGIKKASGFLQEVKIQMKKIDWPSLPETLRSTLLVVGSAVLLAVFLGGVDFLFTTFLNKVLL